MNTNIREIIEAGQFPTTYAAAIKLIDRVNALRKIEIIRNEEEKGEEEQKKEKIHARHYYIKPIFEMEIGERDNPFIVKKIGPTIWKEIILATDEMEADKYMQRMIDRGASDIQIERAEKIMLIGRDKFHKLMASLKKNVIYPTIGFRAFAKKGYRILRRSYLKPSVRALAKAEVNFF